MLYAHYTVHHVSNQGWNMHASSIIVDLECLIFLCWRVQRDAVKERSSLLYGLLSKNAIQSSRPPSKNILELFGASFNKTKLRRSSRGQCEMFPATTTSHHHTSLTEVPTSSLSRIPTLGNCVWNSPPPQILSLGSDPGPTFWGGGGIYLRV
jgi:hypothetical protein